MAWTVSPYALVILGSAVLAVCVGVAALGRRPDPLAWPLALAMFAVAAWATPHAVSLGFSTVDRVAFWHQLRYPGTVVAPVAYLILTLRYAGYDRLDTRGTYAALSVVPLVTVVAVWTNPLHELFWRSLSVVTAAGATVLVPEFGPLYWLNLGYLYSVTVVSLLVLGAVVLWSGAVYRKQALLMFVGGVVPLATNGVINAHLLPGPTVDLTTTALTVSGVTFALALFYTDLLAVRPVARDQLVEELDDGVVVVGPDGRIRDFNATAASILDGLEHDCPAIEVMPADVSADGGELVVEVAGEQRSFRTRSTTLSNPRGREVGRIIHLDDITDLVEREQRISVLNRVLRHNIRNELNVAQGHLELLDDSVDADVGTHVDAALESTTRVFEFAQKARHIEESLRRRETTMVVDAAPAVERVVRDAASRDDAVIEFESAESPDDGVPVRVLDDRFFELAVSELVDNAIVHTDRSPAHVDVRLEADDELVRVVVADDGPGIPEAEIDALYARAESQLQHGSGLGLWLVRWLVSTDAGQISFEENDPRGTVVTLSLPAAASSTDCRAG